LNLLYKQKILPARRQLLSEYESNKEGVSFDQQQHGNPLNLKMCYNPLFFVFNFLNPNWLLHKRLAIDNLPLDVGPFINKILPASATIVLTD
jgi:hypothetical protein